MAKRIPTIPVKEMEAYMQYSVESGEVTSAHNRKYFSDLELVDAGRELYTSREYEEEKRHRVHKVQQFKSSENFASKDLQIDDCDITITRLARPGYFIFDVRVRYRFGLLISFLFTKDEVRRVLRHSKRQAALQSCALFARLPIEIRDRIYCFAIPAGTWTRATNTSFLQNIAEGLDTCSGAYFPFTGIPILQTCWQARSEALSLAYRNTKFCLDDIDEAIQFLVAIGSVGRCNVRALQFSWISRSDQNYQWETAPIHGEFYPTLPVLHGEECAELLKQCVSLSSLHLKFDDFTLTNEPSGAVKLNPSLMLLRSMHKLQDFQVIGMDDEPLEQKWFVEWLRGQILILQSTAS